MPVTTPIVSAIISSVIESVANAPPPALPQPQSVLEAPGYARVLPTEARAGQMLPPQQGAVVIDGMPLRLSPAAQIRSAQNMVVTPAMITHVTMVRYTLDFTGAVHRVWILSPAEAAQLTSR
jgi:hypothetical protein